MIYQDQLCQVRNWTGFMGWRHRRQLAGEVVMDTGGWNCDIGKWAVGDVLIVFGWDVERITL